MVATCAFRQPVLVWVTFGLLSSVVLLGCGSGGKTQQPESGGGEPVVPTPAEDSHDPRKVNVYNKAMTKCGDEHEGGCKYAEDDGGAHQVCVTRLPHGFSTDTGQGDWSNFYTGRPWCVCIWAYSNYILQNKDLALKCESIPATVLEEHYSLEKYAQCGKRESTDGCGAEDIRRSITSLCQQCDNQAMDEASKAALKTKCDKILSSAPAAIVRRLDEQSAIERVAFRHQGVTESKVSGFFFAVCLLGSWGVLARKVFLMRESNADDAAPADQIEGYLAIE